MYGFSNPYMNFNPFTMGGGFGGFNFGNSFQFSNPRAAPSPYSFTPWGSGYFNDAARSGATARPSPFSYSGFGYGSAPAFSMFGGGFGGYNPYANPFSFSPRPFNPAYMSGASAPYQPVKEQPSSPGPSALETPGVRSLSWNAMQVGGSPVQSQGDRRAFGGSYLPFGGRQMVRY